MTSHNKQSSVKTSSSSDTWQDSGGQWEDSGWGSFSGDYKTNITLKIINYLISASMDGAHFQVIIQIKMFKITNYLISASKGKKFENHLNPYMYST